MILRVSNARARTHSSSMLRANHVAQVVALETNYKNKLQRPTINTCLCGKFRLNGTNAKIESEPDADRFSRIRKKKKREPADSRALFQFAQRRGDRARGNLSSRGNLLARNSKEKKGVFRAWKPIKRDKEVFHVLEEERRERIIKSAMLRRTFRPFSEGSVRISRLT